MKSTVVALVLLLVMAIAFQNMAPVGRASLEIDDCLSLREPLSLDGLVSRYGSESIQGKNVAGGRIYVVTPSDEYLQLASSAILVFMPADSEQASWVRCTEGQFAFGEDRM